MHMCWANVIELNMKIYKYMHYTKKSLITTHLY